MKKLILIAILALAFIAMPVSSSWERRAIFLDTAASVSNGSTIVNGTDFTSPPVNIAAINRPGALTIWFNPASPAAVEIEFEFAVSYDGIVFSTDDSIYEIAIPTNSRSVSGTVRTTWPFPFNGVKLIRLERVVANSGAGNCTNVNAAISF